MRNSMVLALLFIAAPALLAQEPVPHVVIKPTVVRPAPVTGAASGPATGQIAKGAIVQVLARDRDWVRVRLEGWVREADLLVSDTTLRALSAADIRSDPAGARGKLVKWEVEAVSLQVADALRTDLRTGEHYLLALGPGAEKTLLYIAIPPLLLASVRSLPPLAAVTVTARVRTGRSEPAGVPILDLQSITRR